MSELAKQHGFSYETMKASIDEAAIGCRRSQPGELVKLLARAKADAIKSQTSRSEGYLLTCDQVGAFAPFAEDRATWQVD